MNTSLVCQNNGSIGTFDLSTSFIDTVVAGPAATRTVGLRGCPNSHILHSKVVDVLRGHGYDKYPGPSIEDVKLAWP